MASYLYFVRLIALFCLFVSLTKVKSWQLEPRIIGGSSAAVKQFPYQVSLRNKEAGLHFCGGSIINRRFILTAAHCFFAQQQPDPTLIYGVVNITHSTEIGDVIEFSDVLLHPEHGTVSAQPDLSLIKSKEDIVFSEFVKPINLPKADIESGVSAVISGWGLIAVSL